MVGTAAGRANRHPRVNSGGEDAFRVHFECGVSRVLAVEVISSSIAFWVKVAGRWALTPIDSLLRSGGLPIGRMTNAWGRADVSTA